MKIKQIKSTKKKKRKKKSWTCWSLGNSQQQLIRPIFSFKWRNIEKSLITDPGFGS